MQIKGKSWQMSGIVLIIEELFVLLFHLLTRLEVLLSENYKQNLLKALWSANNKTKSWNAALTQALVTSRCVKFIPAISTAREMSSELKPL